MFSVGVMLMGMAMMFRGCPFVVRAKEQQDAFDDALRTINGEQPEFVAGHWVKYVQREHRAARSMGAELCTWGFLLFVAGGVALTASLRRSSARIGDLAPNPASSGSGSSP